MFHWGQGGDGCVCVGLGVAWFPSFVPFIFFFSGKTELRRVHPCGLRLGLTGHPVKSSQCAAGWRADSVALHLGCGLDIARAAGIRP